VQVYVDNEIGAATYRAWEEVIRITGCHLVVELMRQGNLQAEEAVMYCKFNPKKK
jgi:N4-(beta-N-acetylglucosaminyl)-L-asparaginase